MPENSSNLLRHEVASLINLFFSQTTDSHLEYYSFNGVYLDKNYISDLKYLLNHKKELLKEILYADDAYLRSLKETFLSCMLKADMNTYLPAYGNEQEWSYGFMSCLNINFGPVYLNKHIDVFYHNKATEVAESDFNSSKVFTYIKNLIMLAKKKNLSKKDKYELIFTLSDIAYELNKIRVKYIKENPKKVDEINKYLTYIAEFLEEYVIDVNNLNKATWTDLMAIYILELGDFNENNPIEVTDINAPTINELREHEGIIEARKKIIETAIKHKPGKSFTVHHYWHYRYKHMEQNLKGEIGLLPLFLGTYKVSCNVKYNYDNTLTINYDVYNKSHLESLTRFGRAQGNSGNKGFMKSKERGVDFRIGGNLEQHFKWTECLPITISNEALKKPSPTPTMNYYYHQ